MARKWTSVRASNDLALRFPTSRGVRINTSISKMYIDLRLEASRAAHLSSKRVPCSRIRPGRAKHKS